MLVAHMPFELFESGKLAARATGARAQIIHAAALRSIHAFQICANDCLIDCVQRRQVDVLATSKDREIVEFAQSILQLFLCIQKSLQMTFAPGSLEERREELGAIAVALEANSQTMPLAVAEFGDAPAIFFHSTAQCPH